MAKTQTMATILNEMKLHRFMSHRIMKLILCNENDIEADEVKFVLL
jgi:hypothetical protein